MDGFWAANRGSVSKASPHINLSEDIFAGLNVKIRHEQSLHTDYLEWEKGREVQFLAGSGFFWKIASGSVGLLRTRDLRTLCQNASIMETFALYFATVAWCFGTALACSLHVSRNSVLSEVHPQRRRGHQHGSLCLHLHLLDLGFEVHRGFGRSRIHACGRVVPNTRIQCHASGHHRPGN